MAESDPNVVYAGMGEACIRGNASPGDGVYKSTDAGRTWKNVGLKDTQQIGRVAVNPQGREHRFRRGAGPSVRTERAARRVPIDRRRRDLETGSDTRPESRRGRSFHGPEQSQRDLRGVLGGVSDAVSASKAAARAADSGNRPTAATPGKICRKNPGMPKGLMGRIGVRVSPANPQRVYALIEADEGGAFRSDNGGDTWVRTNSHNDIRQRAWYYTHIFADPKNVDTVYYLNTGFFRSTDGGRTYSSIQTPHGDNHGLWIAPNDPQRMIESNDGGANVSFNGGRILVDHHESADGAVLSRRAG